MVLNELETGCKVLIYQGAGGFVRMRVESEGLDRYLACGEPLPVDRL